MAVLKDKKRDFYAMKQNLRDEAGAPEHLDSAGDALIRDLARKQTDTATSLQEQLEIRQEFKKGTELKPWSQSGLTTLEKFRDVATQVEEASTSKKSEDYDAERIKTRSGLSRHELELGLVEKPGSHTSALYRFALGNRKGKVEEESLVSKLERHPLNRLKEIEEEVFGGKGTREQEKEEEEPKRKKKRRRRKRVKKRKEVKPTDGRKPKEAEVIEDESEESSEAEDVTSYRPSLWDVKDMRKFCKNEQQGCQIQKLYTIRDGKIIQVNAESSHGS